MAKIGLRLLPPDKELAWMPYVWLVYVVFIPVELFFQGASPERWLFQGVGIAIFLVVYFRSWWVDGPAKLWFVAAKFALGVIFAPAASATLAYFIFGSASIAWAVASATAYRVLAAYIALIALASWGLHLPLGTALSAIIMSAAIGAASIRGAEVSRSNDALREAHDEVRRLAKVAERERIARDLHDVLGHTLSVIVLKSELASRLAERDPARAVMEIRDVERIARESLAELREALAGYRASGIASEIERARGVLHSAGVSFDAEVEPLRMGPSEESVVALAIREAVTNIVRHAKAGSCRLRLERAAGHLTLEIADDGVGGTAAEGSGLLGMRERIEALGGTLARSADPGTRLVLTLPATSSTA